MIRVLSTEVGALKHNKTTNMLEGQVRLNYRSDVEPGLFTAEIGTSVPIEKGLRLEDLEDALVAKAFDYLCLGPHKVARNTVSIFGALREREDQREQRDLPAPTSRRKSAIFALRSVGLRISPDRPEPEHA